MPWNSTPPPMSPTSPQHWQQPSDNTHYLFTNFQNGKLTGLTLYKASTQQPNVTTTLTILRQQSEIH